MSDQPQSPEPVQPADDAFYAAALERARQSMERNRSESRAYQDEAARRWREQQDQQAQLWQSLIHGQQPVQPVTHPAAEQPG